MCGICGSLGVGSDESLEAMAACLRHRGPDSRGTHADGDVRLASQRLRVIDVEGGDQPIYNEDGDVVVVYNGEIYNFQDLRSELSAAGHRFTTDTDTEVVVHGYEEWGTELFARFNGMFAVALYDATDDRLLLARDRAGIKPLYVATTADGMVFASEPKAILRSGFVEPAVDERALAYFLQLRYSPPGTSLFAGIEKLLPGQYIDARRSADGWEVSRQTFWRLSDLDPTPPAEPADAIRDTLERAVGRQLVSDVPLGFYLSGGLDTSSVVAMASRLREEPIHTFCMGFESGEWDERADARAVAEAFDTVHHELTIDGTFMADFPELIWYADEPKRNLWPYYVAREMSDYVTVALGGLGADELFGGYVYRFNRLAEVDALRSLDRNTRNWLRSVGEWGVRRQLASYDLVADDGVDEASLLGYVDDPAQVYVLTNSSDVLGDREFYERRAFGARLAEETVPAELISRRLAPGEGLSLQDKALRWDFGVKLPDDFLLVEDRMSMAHSLESRVPFLDNDLVELAFSLPLTEAFDRHSDGPTAGKRLLRRAMRGILPDQVFEKDKQGFTMPTYPFVRDELLEHAECVLDDPHVVRRGFVRSEYVDTLLERRPQRGLTPHYKLLWKLVGAEIWYQMYVRGDEVGPPGAIEEYYT